ncbi:MAG: tetratricopeptide repeat protein [Anaerolineae bacterium]|nr:tetratricopeptide repeat protein [Anaerolineae bacterium]
MSVRRIVFLFIALTITVGATYVFATDRINLEPAVLASDSVSIELDDSGVVSTTKTTDELIVFWKERFDRNPRDYISLTYLGQAYINKARESGDATAYGRAEAVLNQALDINPNYELTLAFLSTVLFANHDFQGALEMSSRVYDFDPNALHALATVGDAHLELGNYAEAETIYQTLLERNPSPPVYSRLARLAWLQGQPELAITLMQRAVEEVTELGLNEERAAWYYVQLGELYFNTGQLAQATDQYTTALALSDDYYLAIAALGKAHAAAGDYEQAVSRYEQVTNILPDPGFLTALGDLYTLPGRPEEAQQQYDTVVFIAELEALNQVIYNRQLALFYANHDLNEASALELALAELESRQDIYGYDTAAWAYYKNGMPEQAQEMMDQAMRLGTRDAHLFYHAGMIAHALGNTAEAERLLTEALTINPHFDLLQAQAAQTTLEQLQEN